MSHLKHGVGVGEAGLGIQVVVGEKMVSASLHWEPLVERR